MKVYVMSTTALPVRFQLRVQVQALVNGLRRPTSDAGKLLRLAAAPLQTLGRMDAPDAELRQSLLRLSAELEAGRSVDRLQAAALLDRAAAAVGWSRADFRPGQAAAAR
ncbi:MAG TPA: hypothetical protein VF665_08385 [Longimicrobium sp.]|jgi:hypothetical protein|uniref:hypothetical protein n=1 Tax=Longimicrobium sp. TaxID=2029185 RepID=UPI002ED77997